MTEYEIIDAICDSVNPALLLVALGLVATAVINRKFKIAGLVFCVLVGGLLMVYGAQFVDARLGIWESFGGDYSTHSAFAIAVAIAISLGKPWGRWLVLLLLFYGVAMLYQRYHSWLDIGSTAIAIGGPLLLIRWYCGTRIKQTVTNITS